MSEQLDRIIIQTEDKEEMIDALTTALTEGEKFARVCFKILVNDWGADPIGIDKLKLLEGATGHLIDCCMKNVSPTSYKDFISDRLSGYSNIGLGKMGLTRAQYQEKIRQQRKAGRNE